MLSYDYNRPCARLLSNGCRPRLSPNDSITPHGIFICSGISLRTGKSTFQKQCLKAKPPDGELIQKCDLKYTTGEKHRLSASEITELLSEKGVEIPVRTVKRILAEEGFKKLPRRSRLKLGFTVKGAKVPAVSKSISMAQIEGSQFDCQSGGVFLFAPFIDVYITPVQNMI